MSATHKSPEEARSLGNNLRNMRKLHDLTLEEVAAKTRINVGQLSRFERGNFVLVSHNLQKFSDFLQNQNTLTTRQIGLVARFSTVLKKSDRHNAAATAMLTALETLK